MKKQSDLIKNVKRTWKYTKNCKANLIGYTLVCIGEGIIGAVIPLVSAQIILNITSGSIEQLILTAILVFALESLNSAIEYFKMTLYQKIYRKTLVNLQVEVAKETLKLEVGEIDKNTSGLFIDRLNRDTQDISLIFIQYIYWISYTISKIGVIFTIFLLNRYLFLYSIITSMCLFFINRKKLSKQYEVQKQLRISQESKTGLTSELVRGIRDIKVLNASDNILNNVTNKILETSNKEIKIMKLERIYKYFENSLRDIYLVLVLSF